MALKLSNLFFFFSVLFIIVFPLYNSCVSTVFTVSGFVSRLVWIGIMRLCLKQKAM